MTESVEVPFGIAQDGRRYLTVAQLVEHPHLREFLHRFPTSFDFDAEGDVYWFINCGGACWDIAQMQEWQAARRLEALQAQVERLTNALEKAIDGWIDGETGAINARLSKPSPGDDLADDLPPERAAERDASESFERRRPELRAAFEALKASPSVSVEELARVIEEYIRDASVSGEPSPRGLAQAVLSHLKIPDTTVSENERVDADPPRAGSAIGCTDEVRDALVALMLVLDHDDPWDARHIREYHAAWERARAVLGHDASRACAIGAAPVAQAVNPKSSAKQEGSIEPAALSEGGE